MSSGQEVGDIFAYGKGPTTALLRSPTVIIATIALWGMNILLFRKFGIDHVRVLTGGTPQTEDEKDQKAGDKEDASAEAKVSDMTAGKCFSLAFILFVLLNLVTSVWMNVFEGTTISAILLYYAIILTAVIVPLRCTQWIRNGAKIVFRRGCELFNPRCACITGGAPVPVPFIDVFFADGMCSLSKVFFDLGMLWHLLSHFPNSIEPSIYSILIPSAFAALPYIIRARQCLVMLNVGKLKNDPKRYHHTLNAIKYSTSLFPICLSAYQKTVSDERAEELEFILVGLLIVNSVYAYAWDIIMDWGMMQNPTVVLTQTCVPSGAISDSKPSQTCTSAVLRPRLRFGVFLSTVILLSDGFFRFAWVLRFYESYFFSSVDAYILFTEILEIFRRSIWNLLRVEWENIKQTRALAQKNKVHSEGELSSFLPNDESGIQMAPTSVSMRSTATV